MTSEIQAALEALIPAGEVVEIRALWAERGRTDSGYFTDLAQAAQAAHAVSQAGARGVYYSLNFLQPEPYEGSLNKMTMRVRAGQATSDDDIVRRRWLLIDVDPDRPSGTNATADELEAARKVAEQIELWMISETGVLPTKVMSGNGYALLYRIDVPNTDEWAGHIKAFLAELARMFDTGAAHVDQRVWNASRISRLPGTVNRKGEHSEDRPQSLARLVSIGCPTLIPSEWLARFMPPEEAPRAQGERTDRGDAFQRVKLYMATRKPAVEGQNGDDLMLATVKLLWHDFGLPADQAWELLEEWNRICLPPFSRAELEAKVNRVPRMKFTKPFGWKLDELPKNGIAAPAGPGRASKPPHLAGTMDVGAALEQALRALLRQANPWHGTPEELHAAVGIGSASKSLGMHLTNNLDRLTKAGIIVSKEFVGGASERQRLYCISSMVDHKFAQVDHGNEVHNHAQPGEHGKVDHRPEVHNPAQPEVDHEAGVHNYDRPAGGSAQPPVIDLTVKVKPPTVSPPKPPRPPARPPRDVSADEAPEPDDDMGLNSQLRCPAAYPPMVGPLGYWVRNDGVFSQDKEGNWAKRLDAPCVITDRLKSVSDGAEQLIVAHKDERGWVKHSYARRSLADARAAALEMAERGYPCTSQQGKDLTTYLHRFYLANADELPAQLVSAHFGWQGRGELGFLLGRQLVGGESEKAIQFVAQEGLGALADGVRCRGSYERWCDAFRLCQEHDRPLFCVYASFAAPLLSILGASSFVVDLCGETSRGKTTTLKACASVWGVTELDTPASLIQSWNSTPVAIEMRASTLHHLPILLDDTKQVPAKELERVANVVYMLASGQGRQRGSLKGMRVTGTWNTVAISTGETRIRSVSTASGKNTRILTLWGPPFADRPQIARDVKRVAALCRDNFGHAGLRWVEWLLGQRANWESWRSTLDNIRARFSEQCDTPEADRVTEYLAVIDLAAQLVHQALPELGECNSPVPRLLAALVSEVTSADVPDAALQCVYDWAVSNPTAFLGMEIETGVPPSGGWAGKWDGTRDMEGHSIAQRNLEFFRGRMDKILKEGGYQPDEILQRWGDRGYLHRDGRNLTCKRMFQGKRPRLVCFRDEALAAVCGAEMARGWQAELAGLDLEF